MSAVKLKQVNVRSVTLISNRTVPLNQRLKYEGNILSGQEVPIVDRGKLRNGLYIAALISEINGAVEVSVLESDETVRAARRVSPIRYYQVRAAQFYRMVVLLEDFHSWFSKLITTNRILRYFKSTLGERKRFVKS